ncbi:MAG: AmmeMemoRadiSam system radical SAM enzyme [Chloroflexi bacterium]|nr:AmmeMemoRadiSam system radical SAM enzyme [Chloroflexota bacterium]
MKEALLYEKLEGARVRCMLCAHRCVIAEGRRGVCHVRENRAGTLYSLVYGQLIAQAVDPIEKKPLFHFYPGSRSFSIATMGCNFRCLFCQNADISQTPRETGRILGHETLHQAIIAGAQRTGCQSISYTYTEPTVFFEYTLDVSRLAHEAGLANVYVTNGYMSPEMLDVIAPSEGRLLDAANVDLKAFTEDFYREMCGARLQPVLDALKIMKARGVWVEVTTLIIPGANDSEGELREIARFICTELDAETPWHVSRFYPTYRLTDRPPTPPETVLRAREIGLEEGLRYVYAGNLPGHGEDTLCPGCGRAVIRRMGFRVLNRDLHEGACAHCGTRIAGIGL